MLQMVNQTTCRDFKVFVLDYNDTAAELGLEPCRLDDNLVVEMATGTVFPQKEHHSPTSPVYDAAGHAQHHFGTHAAPWLMLNVILEVGRYSLQLCQDCLMHPAQSLQVLHRAMTSRCAIFLGFGELQVLLASDMSAATGLKT